FFQVQGGLREDGQVSLPEQVTTFLIILAHHKKKIVVYKLDFVGPEKQLVVIRIQSILFAKASPVEEDCVGPTWRRFKGCLGVLDGIYIEVTVPESEKSRYRTKKRKICTNVLRVCNRKMSFVY
ncbi:hypothetical protein S83_012566, partial [Arachis hypogaea]